MTQSHLPATDSNESAKQAQAHITDVQIYFLRRLDQANLKQFRVEVYQATGEVYIVDRLHIGLEFTAKLLSYEAVGRTPPPELEARCLEFIEDIIPFPALRARAAAILAAWGHWHGYEVCPLCATPLRVHVQHYGRTDREPTVLHHHHHLDADDQTCKLLDVIATSATLNHEDFLRSYGCD